MSDKQKTVSEHLLTLVRWLKGVCKDAGLIFRQANESVIQSYTRTSGLGSVFPPERDINFCIRWIRSRLLQAQFDDAKEQKERQREFAFVTSAFPLARNV